MNREQVDFKELLKYEMLCVIFSNVGTSDILPWVFFMFFILGKWYKITQHITYHFNFIQWHQFFVNHSYHSTFREIDDLETVFKW